MECIQSLISLYSYLPNLISSNKDFFQAVGPFVIAAAAIFTILRTSQIHSENREHEKKLKLKDLKIGKIEELYTLHNEIEEFINEISKIKPFIPVSTEGLPRITFPKIDFIKKGVFTSLAYFNYEPESLRRICSEYIHRVSIFKDFFRFSISPIKNNTLIVTKYKKYINPSPSDGDLKSLQDININAGLFLDKNFLEIVQDLHKDIRGFHGYYDMLIENLQKNNEQFLNEIHSLQEKVVNS